MERRSIEEALLSHIIGDLSEIVISYLEMEVRVDSWWGKEGSGKGEFKYPTCVCRLPSGEIVVADSGNHRLQVFSSSGKFLRQWGKEGSGQGEFNHPRRVAFLPREGKKGRGEIFVVDSWNHRIQVFSFSPGEGERFLRQWGKEGSGEGEFDQPKGIAFLPGGKVAIVCADSPWVQIFTREGKFLNRWGEHQLADITDIVSLSGGRVLVFDKWSRRIQIFTEEGEFLELVELVPSPGGLQVFDVGEAYLWQRGQTDTPGWWLHSPADVAYLSNHSVAVPNVFNHQIQILELHYC